MRFEIRVGTALTSGFQSYIRSLFISNGDDVCADLDNGTFEYQCL